MKASTTGEDIISFVNPSGTGDTIKLVYIDQSGTVQTWTTVDSNAPATRIIVGGGGAGAPLEVKINLPGGAGRLDANWVTQVNLKFFQPGKNVLTGAVDFTYSCTTAKVASPLGAKCTIPSVDTGTWDITVQAADLGSLTSVKRSVSVVAGSNTIDFGSLLLGDYNDNDKVELFDFPVFKLSFDKQKGDAGWDSKTDRNGDDKTGLFDFPDFKVNFDISAPVEVP